MNYRRLLDKSMSCDWKYIVDKIVCNNDQQASIFLQQKFKVGTAERKFGIVEAFLSHVLLLFTCSPSLYLSPGMVRAGRPRVASYLTRKEGDERV